MSVIFIQNYAYPLQASKIWLSENWAHLIHRVQALHPDPSVTATLLVAIAMGTCFWAASLLWLFVDYFHKPDVVYETKHEKNRTLHPEGSPYNPPLWRAFLLVLFNQVCVVLPTIWMLDKGSRALGLGLVVSDQLPSMREFITHALLSILFVEISFYYSHRLLHTPWFYKHVHKVHHEYKATIGLAALYAHPFEAMLGNTVAVMGAPFLLKANLFTLFLASCFGWIFTTNGHSGYAIFNPDGFHNFHHSKNSGNFGTLRFMDMLHGTDKVWRAYISREKAATRMDPDKYTNVNKIVWIIGFFSAVGLIDYFLPVSVV